jgi:rfaE bifunctional protein kinase chain/domain
MNPPNISEDKLLILMESEGIVFNDLRNAVASFSGTPVHVVGDTIIDSYTYCDMIGGMTKTPTISLRYGKKIDFSGGAAIVAKHMKAAGAIVTFSTVLGDDFYKDFLLNDMKKYSIECFPIIDSLRPTTNKNAFVVGDYRVLKVDVVDNRSISDKILNKLIKQINSTETKAVIFSDFRHGIFNPKTIQKLISAIPEEVYKVADSQVASRWGNIMDFKNFDLITPNEKEARFSMGDQDSVIRHLAYNLYNLSGTKTLILKLGSRGVIIFRNAQEDLSKSFFLDSFAPNVVDAVGAGDALLAYSTLAMINTKNEVIAGILGSFAAAIECGYDGNIPVTRKSLEDFITKIEKQVFYK